MGLDMYLMRFPRVHSYTADELSNVESYLDYQQLSKSEKAKYTPEEWCGVDVDSLPPEKVLEDIKRRYGSYGFHEEVGYWRKASEIHQWFVNNVQDGIDDCRYHNEVHEEILQSLYDTCKELLNNVKLIPGTIVNGYRYNNGKREAMTCDGMVVDNPELCRQLLPRQEGFFFGDVEYDEYYIDDIKQTMEICERVLNGTDFDTQMIYYLSSW